MATQTVTISLVKEGQLAVTPDPVMVNPGDIISWQLDKGLKWPPEPATAITRAAAKGSVDLLGNTISWVPGKDPLQPGTIEATVAGKATPDSFEDYNAEAVQEGNEAVILSTHKLDSIDPKIKLNPK